ncbi:hypothetical protein VP01_2471g2 [Puccinia sorghi]|uniref:Uncharacterized protein n=1 Tax=Puccinia sorghi TaxID=27349 RepID=A0A0L6V6L2_9BASI|nr:hypothetical protein VP01_2471g2 [Puccinia sorghi]
MHQTKQRQTNFILGQLSCSSLLLLAFIISCNKVRDPQIPSHPNSSLNLPLCTFLQKKKVLFGKLRIYGITKKGGSTCNPPTLDPQPTGCCGGSRWFADPKLKMTVPKHLNLKKGGVWMAAFLEHAASQLQEVEQVFFCTLCFFPCNHQTKMGGTAVASSIRSTEPPCVFFYMGLYTSPKPVSLGTGWSSHLHVAQNETPITRLGMQVLKFDVWKAGEHGGKDAPKHKKTPAFYGIRIKGPRGHSTKRDGLMLYIFSYQCSQEFQLQYFDHLPLLYTVQPCVVFVQKAHFECTCVTLSLEEHQQVADNNDERPVLKTHTQTACWKTGGIELHGQDKLCMITCMGHRCCTYIYTGYGHKMPTHKLFTIIPQHTHTQMMREERKKKNRGKGFHPQMVIHLVLSTLDMDTSDMGSIPTGHLLSRVSQELQRRYTTLVRYGEAMTKSGYIERRQEQVWIG